MQARLMKSRALIFALFSALLLAAVGAALLPQLARASGNVTFITVGVMTDANDNPDTATTLNNGTALITFAPNGITQPPGTPSVANLYDPITKTFSLPTGGMNCEHIGATATKLQNGTVLIAGDSAGTPCSEIYDPGTQTFTRVGNMDSSGTAGGASSGGASILLPDGTVFVPFSVTSGDLFDPTTGLWTRVGNPTVNTSASPGSIAATITSSGQVLLVDVAGEAALYDPSAQTFTALGGSIPKSQVFGVVVPLNSSTVLVAGGGGFVGNEMTKATYIYRLDTQTFTRVGDMTQFRALATATVLPSGRVLVMGGSSGMSTDTANTAEVYSPQTGLWTAVDQMGVYRYDPRSTLLNDGTVLVVGGESGSSNPGGVEQDGEVADIQQYPVAVQPTGTGSGTVTSSPAGISCPGNCTGNYDFATSVTLTATPASGSVFAGWSGAGCSGTGTCEVSADQALGQSVVADFEPAAGPVNPTLNVSLAGTGSGSVSGPAISCPGICGGAYGPGTVVDLTAAAASGSTFAGWSGACSGTGACEVTLNSDQSVVANFTQDQTPVDPGQPTEPTQPTNPAPPARGNPLAVILSGPRPESADTSATFGFDGTNVDSYRCLVDLDGWVPCTTGQTFSGLLPGYHEFQLQGLQDGGASSQIATYYWQVDSPQQCVLKSGRARAFVYAKQNRVRLVYPYKSYKSASNVTATLFAVLKQHKLVQLTSKTLNLKKQSVIRVIKNLPKSVMTQVHQAKSFQVQLHIPNTVASCSRYLTKQLTVQEKVDGQFVWFPTDVSSFPGGVKAWLKN